MSNQASSQNRPVTSVRGGASATATPANSGPAPSQHINSAHAGFHERGGSEQTRDPSYPPYSTEDLKGTPRTDNLADKLSNAGTATGAMAAEKAHDVVESGNTVVNKTEHMAQNTANAASSAASNAAESAQGLGSKIVSGVTNMFTGQPRMTSNTEQAKDAARGAMGSMGANSGSQGIASTVQDKVGDAFGTGKGSAHMSGHALAKEFAEDYKLESNPGEDRMPMGMAGADEGSVRK
ncbi:hypothetical protein BJ508DRAFT_415168 [Ascobolus immersus RN42]|uniref:Uncharacterized protein n=1 Tax=Ascobolus immersus RN42 TaxID=1160509 RepID=A0A3N4I9Q3_ASCIM|nr:hypothetical protein BJ508DRAFT_415168 [Ascobolus immersus RN42]